MDLSCIFFGVLVIDLFQFIRLCKVESVLVNKDAQTGTHNSMFVLSIYANIKLPPTALLFLRCGIFETLITMATFDNPLASMIPQDIFFKKSHSCLASTQISSNVSILPECCILREPCSNGSQGLSRWSIKKSKTPPVFREDLIGRPFSYLKWLTNIFCPPHRFTLNY